MYYIQDAQNIYKNLYAYNFKYITEEAYAGRLKTLEQNTKW